jgi:cell division protein FtsZ
MQVAGSALMAIGRGTGDTRCIDAARQAIESPLLEISIEGAKGVLFNITGGTDLGMMEVHEAASVIQQAADPDANIIFGAVIDPEMGNDVQITLIATGFDSVRRDVHMRGTFVQRDTASQAVQGTQAPSPVQSTSNNGSSHSTIPSRTPAQPAPNTEQPAGRPTGPRPVQPQSGDDIDVPPFLFPKFKDRN